LEVLLHSVSVALFSVPAETSARKYAASKPRRSPSSWGGHQ